MSSRSGERGPPRERERNSTGRSGSRRRGEEREGEGRERPREERGGVGAGVLDSEGNGRIPWQPSLIGRLS